MNKFKLLALSALLMVFNFTIQAQSASNLPFLKAFAEQKLIEAKESAQRAEAYALANNIALIVTLDDGTIIQLMDVVDGKPIYQMTDNVGAAKTTRAFELWEGGSTGLNLNGEGYDRLGVWDGGAVRTTHQEFNNLGPASRVTQVDGATSLSDHATHVSGTLVGGGVVANARGMNYKGLLKAHDWTNAESEMATAAASGLEISSHSYGPVRGWSNSTGSWVWHGNASVTNEADYLFGFYGSRSRDWDQIAYNAPNYLIIASAGNDRGDGPSNAGQGGVPPFDGGIDGFDCIGDAKVGKNTMAIGAVNAVLEYTGPSSVVMSSFSGWGPTDDGRIKPDVVAKGVGTYSAGSNNNTHYSTKNGTSMASPNAAGTMALLQQHYQATHGSTPMRSSTLKGLVIHTADEAGPAPGPDYMFGWGLMNAERAAALISEDDVQQNSIDEITLANNETYTREINASGNQALRVTICWTDPAATIGVAAYNDRTPKIVHDLNLKLIGPDSTYFPYQLNPEIPTAPPTNTGKNNVDNVELIHIELPEAGTYSIAVDHDGTLNADQVFSLIISGINEYQGLPFCSEALINPSNNSTDNFLDQTITWAQAAFATDYLVYFGTDGEGQTKPSNIINGLFQIDNFFDAVLDPNTTYYLSIVPQNTFGANEDCAEIWSFTTLSAISEFPYIIDVEGVSAPSLPDLWQQLQNGDAKWVSTNLISYEGVSSLGCFNTSGLVISDLDNWLISPPIAVEAGKEYNISFHYRAFLPGTTEQIGLYWGNAVDSSAFTTKLMELSGFDGAQEWLFAETVFVPETDTYGYLAWKAETDAGYGVFLDQLKVEDWGPVSIKENETSSLSASYNNGQLKVWMQKNNESGIIELYNVNGNLIMKDQFSTGTSYSKAIQLTSGVYIISMKTENSIAQRKMIVR